MKRFILRDEYALQSPELLNAKEYVEALEEALQSRGYFVTTITEKQAQAEFED